MLHYFLAMFFLMVAFHFIADFPLQGDYLARGKFGLLDTPELRIKHWCMIAHCCIQAVFVGLITTSLVLALCEFTAHLIIDTSKVDNKITFNQDQFAHLFCKLVWATLAIYCLS